MPVPDLQPGSDFAGHRIERKLASGGMATVYLATHVMIDRPRALKLISAEYANDQTFHERFRLEMRMAAKLRHPNVVTTHDAGVEDGQPFISMEYIDGKNLAELIEQEGPLQPERAVRIVEQIAGALDAAHEQQQPIVHRDVKPHNVLIDWENGDEWAYLTDFGLAKAATEAGRPAHSGFFSGTWAYAPPEQRKGQGVDKRADIYSLGGLLFYAVTGQPPNQGKALSDSPPALSPAVAKALPALEEVIHTAMPTDPGERFRSAGDLAQAAREALTATRPPESERTLPMVSPKHRPPRTKRGLLRYLILAVPALALIAFVIFRVVVPGPKDKPNRVVLAIDTSSSMNDPFTRRDPRTRIEVAKQWGQEGLNKLADDDEVGFWSFATPIPERYMMGPLKPLGEYEDRARLLVDANLVPAGGTPLYDVIVDGVDELRSEMNESATTVLIILTDGGQKTRSRRDSVQYKTVADVEDLAARIKAAEPTKSVLVLITAAADVGCGDTGRTDLRRIARLFDGECYPAATTDELQAALPRILEVVRTGKVNTS